MDYYITDYNTQVPPGAKRCALEDSIMHKGKPVTAGSKMLEGFISPIDAAVVTRLINDGVVITGKTAMDEFGVAPVFDDDTHEVPGAILAVKSGSADFALCNDISGRIRLAAPEHGLCYINPTYGTVSRYGLIHAVSSMDRIGALCKTPDVGFNTLAKIAGHDPGDGAMFPDETYSYSSDKTGIKIAADENALKLCGDSGRAAVSEFLKHFETVGINLPYRNVLSQVMYILSCAELSNNLTRYDGIKFGYRTAEYNSLEELYTKSRTEAFTRRVKLASIMGAMVLSQENYDRYYDKAMRIRRLIKDSFDFTKYDAVILPELPGTEHYEQLAGLPSICVPYGGGAVRLMAAAKNENVLYSAVKAVGL